MNKCWNSSPACSASPFQSSAESCIAQREWLVSRHYMDALGLVNVQSAPSKCQQAGLPLFTLQVHM